MTMRQVFVARERELGKLQQFLDDSLDNQGQVCFVTGEAGSGKTALLTEFARRAQATHPDLLVALGNCNAQTGIGDPYLPFREALGLLTGDVGGKLAQSAISQENARRLQDFLPVAGQALVDFGSDLIDIFVSGSRLAARARALPADTGAIEIFFSYSHEDEELRNELDKHLSFLKRQGVVTWHDREIAAGREWEGDIDTHLSTAPVILLLVSPGFMASDYCMDVETKLAMERHEAGQARVIPILLRQVDWMGAPFGKLQCLPTNATPVTSWANRDEAFTHVAQGIKTTVEELVASGTKAGWLYSLEKLAKRKTPAPSELQQIQVFQQYTNVLQAMTAEQPLMLLLDDLQWADAASASLLFHLGQNIGESRVLIVGAYRPTEVAVGRLSSISGQVERHPLEKVLTEFKRHFGDIWVNLDQTDEIEAKRFVDAFLDTEPSRLSDEFRQSLLRRTEGHPLFTIELLRDMQERQDIVQDEEGYWVERSELDWETLPARVEGVIEERIGRLKEELCEILSVASVEGEDFTAQVIARVQEIQERQLLRKLSRELGKRHRLVRERGETQIGRHILSRYQFTHTLFQQYLYNELSDGQRRLLHREIAVVLEELYEGRTEEIAVQLARHYTEAGVREKAIDYLLQAGDRARMLYAHQEAIDYYQRALEFLRKERAYERAARTLMKLGLTYHIAFNFRRARQAFEEGFALWQWAGETPVADSLPPAPHALRVDWPYPPLTLDPTMARDVDSTGVIDQLFSGLVELSPRMDVMPGVARSWEVSEGGRKYVFRLRDDVWWSDGTPVTARDFEYAWKRVLDPATESPTASLLYDVKGARHFHQGEVSEPDCVGVRALDEVTLVVELEQPTSYFLYLLTYNASYPVPRHVVETYGEVWARAGNIVTNGPFILETWDQGQSMVLSRNPDYYGQFRGNVQRVELSLLSEWSAGLEMYEAAELDILSLWDLLQERDRARQRHAGEYISGPQISTLSVGFNVRRHPFDDPRVRLAFVHAVDRETLTDVIMHGYEFPATGGFLPPGMPGHSAGISLPYDPDLARQLLAEAGYPDGNGFPPVNLLADLGREPLSKYLQAQWRANLGIEITWETVEWAEFMDRLDKTPPHMFLFAWGSDYPDPDNFLRVCDAVGKTGWRNKAYDGLIAEARQVTDQEERMKMYAEADRLLIGQAAIMPFTYGRLHLLVKPWVKRFPTSATKWWFWKDVVIEPH